MGQIGATPDGVSSASGGGAGSGAGGSGAGGTGADGSTGGVAGAIPMMGMDGRYKCDDTTHGSVAGVRRLTTAEYQNAIVDLFGVPGSQRYPGSYGKTVTGYSTEPALSQVGEQGVEQIVYAAEDVAEALSPKFTTLLPCAAQGDNACATTYLQKFGRRAFRRSLTDDERTSLMATYSAARADGATFAEALSVMTSQLLQMPAFLYVLEAPSDRGVDRKLTGPELASRLSLLLWNSLPDDTLLDAAESGALADKAAVLTQAKRMLGDPRSDRGLGRFFREWTQTTVLSPGDKDAATFPYLNDAFAASVNQSFDRFVIDQVRTGKDLTSLLRSNSTFIDSNLATFYGMSAPSDWTKVDLPADRYSGIMTQPAMLAALAHAAETSYVFRGRFVRKRLLCEDIGIPPGNAMSEFAAIPKPANPTARDLSTAVRARGTCGACHSLIDPAGLAFEHFDAMGKYRDMYSTGKAIDTSGSLDNVGGTMSIAFSSPTDMLDQLAKLPSVRDCFARQIFRYGSSHTENAADSCAIQQLGDALQASDGRLDSAFLEATQTEAFLYRRGE